ncbi:hypothetical protein QOZ80_2BG0184140 [Eleusine coracana subsp. coracana]|nr:hypothetical protein QOZ80_2BG0184140 [Eleusine coracana subsp. coracana]
MDAAAKRVQQDTPVLPDELVEEIFSYLPAKSLRRLECLSRSWRKIITSSSAFHDLFHSKRAGCRDNHRLFVRPCGSHQLFYAWQPNGDGTVEEIMDRSSVELNLPQGEIFPVSKSCHGLVLLTCFEYNTYYVWNPSTRDILKLPDRIASYTCCYGMGRCSTTNQYKVSRDWRAVIKNELFINQHLSHANLNKSPQVMFTDGNDGSFKRLENFISTSGEPPMVDNNAIVVCSKPCHGLNAGSYAGYDFVCNPATNYYKALRFSNGDRRELRGQALQEYKARRLANFMEEDVEVFSGRLGFGYDKEAEKHALVRLTYTERNLETRAYTLSGEFRYVEDMYWDVLLDPPPRPIANTPPAHVKGKLYWMVDTRLGQRSPYEEIVMLDLSTCEFEVLHGPPHKNDNCSDCTSSILELQELVCVAYSYHSTNNIGIWVMEDTGSWSLGYCIELGRFSPEYSTYVTTPLAVNPLDGKILLSTGRALGYYDPKTMEIETIYRLGSHVSGDKKFVPILFQESLVNPCDRV